MIIDITAAGIEADTVIPAYNPRYALAAVIKTPRITPTMITLRVNSIGDSSAEMYGSPKALIISAK
jgi:hypothetical protein